MRFEDRTSVAKRSHAWAIVATFLLLLFLRRLTWHLDVAPTLAILAACAYGVFETARKPVTMPKSKRDVVADERGLRVDGKLVAARASIRRVSSVVRDDGMRAVHVTGRWPWQSRVVFVEGAEKSRALVAALDPENRHGTTAHYRAQPPWAKHLRTLAAALGAGTWMVVTNVSRMPLWAQLALLGVYAMLLAPAVLPLRVSVGSDGILLRGPGRRRFVSFRSIREVVVTKVGVELLLDGEAGEKLEIRLTLKDNHADAQIGELVERVERGIEGQSEATAAEVEAFLGRGERDAATWLADMRALGREMGGYRVATITRDRLWEVVENPSSDPSAREGAAFALSAQLDEQERERLAALAATTAWPRLRVALEGVSQSATTRARRGDEDEDERLRLALEEADADDLADLAPSQGDGHGRAARRTLGGRAR